MTKKEDRLAKFGADNCPAPPLRPGMAAAFRGRKDVGRTCRLNGDNINCDRRSIGKYESFTLEQHGDKFALKAANGRYCADDHDRIRCNRAKVYGWEMFKIEHQSKGGVAIRGGRANQYCADEGHRIICNRHHIGGWEVFSPTCVEGCNPNTCIIAEVGSSPRQNKVFKFSKGGRFLKMDATTFDKVPLIVAMPLIPSEP